MKTAQKTTPQTPQSTDRLGANRPSSTRLRKMSEGVDARKQAIDVHYGGRVRTADENEARRNERRTAHKNYTLALGSLMLAGMATIALAAGRGRHDQPVDVSKLPASELTRVHVSPDSPSHSAAGIAGDVVNDKTDVNQVTAEIEKAVGGEVVAATAELKLPADQTDPGRVQAFETGR